MAKSVDAKLTKLSNEYSANVKKVRELEAAKKKPFATDAEVKRINQEIDKLEAERKTIVENTNTLSKAAKSVDEYTDLNKKLAQYESQIAKRIARGEGTADLDKIKQETLGKLEKIAPAVEKNFPELKKAEPKSTKTGPLGNVQMTTGTSVAGTTASKAEATKKKVSNSSSCMKIQIAT
jgi:predicted  nucleic acid-binding Zn-ribbon protein